MSWLYFLENFKIDKGSQIIQNLSFFLKQNSDYFRDNYQMFANKKLPQKSDEKKNSLRKPCLSEMQMETKSQFNHSGNFESLYCCPMTGHH